MTESVTQTRFTPFWFSLHRVPSSLLEQVSHHATTHHHSTTHTHRVTPSPTSPPHSPTSPPSRPPPTPPSPAPTAPRTGQSSAAHLRSIQANVYKPRTAQPLSLKASSAFPGNTFARPAPVRAAPTPTAQQPRSGPGSRAAPATAPKSTSKWASYGGDDDESDDDDEQGAGGEIYVSL